MKKIFITLLTAILLVSNIPVYASEPAEASIISCETIYISDELYIEITTEEASITSTYATSSTKTSSKTATMKNNTDEVIAKFKLAATFTYDGSTSKCTSVSHSATIYDDSWEFTSISSSKSGATATGKYTIKKYLLFINTQTVSDTITIKCDKNGNIS